MGTTIVELSEERETTAGELKRVCEFQHNLECAERRLRAKRDARDELDWEASHHPKELQEAQAKVVDKIVRKSFPNKFTT